MEMMYQVVGIPCDQAKEFETWEELRKMAGYTSEECIITHKYSEKHH